MLWLSVDPAVLSVDPAVVLVSAPSRGCDLGCLSTGAAGGQPAANLKLRAGFIALNCSRRRFPVVISIKCVLWPSRAASRWLKFNFTSDALSKNARRTAKRNASFDFSRDLHLFDLQQCFEEYALVSS